MRQSSRVESSARSPQADSLHSVLQNALANLDIQLEEELSRYRRLRAGGKHTYRYMSRKSFSKTPDLMPIASAPGRQQSPAPPDLAPASQDSNPVVAAGLTSPPAPPATADHPATATTPASPAMPAPVEAGLAIASQPPSDALTPGPSSSQSAPPDQIDALFSSSPSTTTDLTKLMQAVPGLEDYLESSEELLRSLAEEEAEIQAERGFMQNLVTPLGVGSMLLLLLSSAMFGYVLMNPSTLNRLLTAHTASSTQPLAPTAPVPSGAAGTITSAPNPNLAAQEFKDLSLSTLGTVKVNHSSPTGLPNPAASAKPTASPAPLSTRLGASGSATTIPGSPPRLNQSGSIPIVDSPVRSPQTFAPAPPVDSYTPPVAAPPPARPAYTAPARPYRPPVAEPAAPVTPAPPLSSAPTPASTGETPYGYKIITHYGNDRALEEARKVVPDAFVHNFPDAGAKVQLGAYGDAASAEARAQELRNQGISVEVYKP